MPSPGKCIYEVGTFAPIPNEEVIAVCGDRSENVIKSFFNRMTILIFGIVIIVILAIIFLIIYFVKKDSRNLTVFHV